jgi:hypothetical protein
MMKKLFHFTLSFLMSLVLAGNCVAQGKPPDKPKDKEKEKIVEKPKPTPTPKRPN